ncbi:tetratricopeptide repeat protein [Tichowtungia aerotolerans]|uniref:Tetratricopeptide repeat protein n=1 Tax=Tichowtungia aerotolerans TaxID=2697043 RepID=A0A6P1MGZ6_9BACT|nr:tetratricopeptide repeat protein [Tichowtungia aerotolerans]QHI70355.1 hypothetical protein GT409_13200 [Tichowtungia aerotolerans]
MMKRIVILLTSVLCCLASAQESRTLNAKLNRADGKAFRVILEDCDGTHLTYSLESGRESKTLPLVDIKELEIQLPKLSLDALQAKLVAAEYAEVVSALEPVVGGAGIYMVVPNNAVSLYALLTKAYLRNGDIEKARGSAEQLKAVSDAAVKKQALATIAQCVLEAGELDEAGRLIGELSDPVAKLYLTARLQRAAGQSKEAIQTVIDLIASYPNDHNWMPQTEYLDAQLYLDLGMPDSAAEVAHQVMVLYPRSEFKVEAQKLLEEINRLTEEESVQAE